jgi:hypothetical protein
MNNLKTNFIPRGLFDKNVGSSIKSDLTILEEPDVYRNNNMMDNRVQSNDFLGNFADNFYVLDNSKNDIIASGIFMSNYGIKPLPIPYSRQIYKPFDDSKYFELGDPYIPSRGSNLNKSGDNHPIMPFNAIDLIEDTIYKKIKGLSMEETNVLNRNN